MQWQIEVTGAKQCALSVIFAANEPVREYIERDEAYAAEMVKRGKKFMACVAKKTPPVVLPPVAPPIIPEKVADMNSDQEWCKQAGIWLQTVGAAQSAKESETALKMLVAADMKKAFGAGVMINRDKAGRLSLRKEAP
jgi:hypothetical protein